MDNQYLKAKEILKKYNQEHLLAFYDKLTQEKKEKLINQILNINFEQINKLYENTKKPIEKDEAKIEPITYIDKNNISDEERKNHRDIIRIYRFILPSKLLWQPANPAFVF